MVFACEALRCALRLARREADALASAPAFFNVFGRNFADRPRFFDSSDRVSFKDRVDTRLLRVGQVFDLLLGFFTPCHVGALLGLPSETLRGYRSRRWSLLKKSSGRRMTPPGGLLPTLRRSGVRFLRSVSGDSPGPSADNSFPAHPKGPVNELIAASRHPRLPEITDGLSYDPREERTCIKSVESTSPKLCDGCLSRPVAD